MSDGLSLAEDTTLTVHEQEQLQIREDTIEQARQRIRDDFVTIGEQLKIIRKERLYRSQYATFEGYCEQRWQLHRNYINKMIAASEVIENLGTIVPFLPPPANEAQARPLAALPPDEQATVWTEAVETAPNGKVTAAHIKATVDRRQRQQEPQNVELVAHYAVKYADLEVQPISGLAEIKKIGGAIARFLSEAAEQGKDLRLQLVVDGVSKLAITTAREAE